MIGKLQYRLFRWTYRLFRWFASRWSPVGLLVLAGLAISSVAGLDTNKSMAHQIFTFLLALTIIALILGLFFRKRFSGQRHIPQFATVGETLTYHVEIHNPSSRVLKGLLFREEPKDPVPSREDFLSPPFAWEKNINRLERGLGLRRWFHLLSRNITAKTETLKIPNLPPRGRIELKVGLTPRKRGRLELEGFQVICPEPLGLFRPKNLVKIHQSLLILPRRYSLPPIDLPGSRKHQPGGVALASSVGDAEEFISMRDYRPGDPLRRIHWRSWAKAGRPIVKDYQEEYFVRHALILDTFSKAAGDPVFEEAVSVAASFVTTVETRESLLDLMFVGAQAFCFTTGRGLAHVDKMLEVLASVQECQDKPFETLFPLVLDRAGFLSACIVILLSWDSVRQRFVNGLKALGLPLKVLVITDELEEEPDPGPMKDQPGAFHVLKMGKIEEGLSRL